MRAGKHNKEFKSVAENIGLIVEEDEKYGWAITTLTEQHYKLISNIEYDKSIFNLECIVKPSEDKEKKPKEKKPKYKHYCPNGHNKPFSLSEQQLHLKCSLCNADLLIEEEVK